MNAYVTYAILAAAVAVGVYIAREVTRQPGSAAPDKPLVWSVVAGLLWPVVLVGVIQFGLVLLIRARVRASAGAIAPVRVLTASVLVGDRTRAA